LLTLLANDTDRRKVDVLKHKLITLPFLSPQITYGWNGIENYLHGKKPATTACTMAWPLILPF